MSEDSAKQEVPTNPNMINKSYAEKLAKAARNIPDRNQYSSGVVIDKTPTAKFQGWLNRVGIGEKLGCIGTTTLAAVTTGLIIWGAAECALPKTDGEDLVKIVQEQTKNPNPKTLPKGYTYYETVAVVQSAPTLIERQKKEEKNEPIPVYGDLARTKIIGYMTQGAELEKIILLPNPFTNDPSDPLAAVLYESIPKATIKGPDNKPVQQPSLNVVIVSGRNLFTKADADKLYMDAVKGPADIRSSTPSPIKAPR